MIAKSLPSYAAEIISRSTFMGPSYHTPIDLIRMALLLMEQEGDIVRSQSSSIYQQDEEGGVAVDNLISSFEHAAEILEGCVQVDSEDMDCLSWLVACRMGCMILGSAITIGGGPNLAAPPSYAEHTRSDSKVRHVDYHKYRAAASDSYRSLIEWRSKSGDNGSRFHFVVKACLEWDEAMFLLSFRPVIHHDCFLKIRLLHAAHTVELGLREPSVSSLNSVMSLYESGLIKKMKLLSTLSSLVEADSTNKNLWVLLVFALGPVGTKKKSKRCKDEFCRECKRLREGHLDHKNIRRQKKKDEWWAAKKVKWWDFYYFVIPPSKKIRRIDVCQRDHFFNLNRKNAIAETRALIESNHLEQALPKLFSKENDINSNLSDVTWMWSVEPSEEDEEDHLQSDSESDTDSKPSSLAGGKISPICKDLPCRDVPNVFESQLLPLSEKISLKLGIDCIIACKVLVACHMYGTCHEFVKDGVGYLWKRIFRSKKGERSCEALCFLAHQNLDIESYLRDFDTEFRMPQVTLNSFQENFTSL